MAINTDSPAARILAGSLRQARQESGLSLRALEHKLKISYSVISYWETAKRVPSLEDAASLLTALGITGERRATILRLVRDASMPDYLAVGSTGMSQQLHGMLECERSACTMIDWSPMVIPGLLQTSAYARCVLTGGGRKPGPDTEHQVTRRAERRDALTRARPLTLDALIGEAALHQRIGSGELMVEQLQHLRTMAEWHTVTVRVLRAGGDFHPGLMGPFVFYEFPTAEPIVLLEHLRASAFVYDAEDITAWKNAADTIRTNALSPQDSSRLIAAAMSKMEASP